MVSEKEMRVIMELRKNSRSPLVEISKNLSIPVSSVHDLIKSSKAIKNYTTIVDFPGMGYNIRKNILIKVSNKESFEKFILKSKHVNSAYRLSGKFSYLIDCIFMYMKDHDAFMQQLRSHGVLEKKCFFVTDSVKTESFLSNMEG